MYTLNFANGNVQTYGSYIDLMDAVRAWGGEAKLVNSFSNTYVFVPKK